MTMFAERPTTPRVATSFLPAPVASGIVPAPGTSPDGPDVPTVAPGELIDAGWGSAIAGDLSELWTDKVDTVRTITVTAPLTGGGDLSADRSLAISDFTSGARGTVPASGGGAVNFLRADGTWVAPAGGSGGGVPTTRLINTTAPLSGGGDLSADRTLAVATVSSGAAGVAPASGGGTTNFLRADGTWAAPAGGGGGVTDGDKGDIVVSASGATWMFDTAVVTAAAKTVLDDTSTTAMRTTLALGNVDNTSDASKPVSTAQAAADALKADKTLTIATTAPLAGGGDLSANRTLTVAPFSTTTTASGVVPGSNAAAVTNFLRADGTWAIPPGGGGGISGVVVQEENSTVVATATGFDFGNGFDITANAAEAVVALDLGEYTGTNLPNAKVAGLGTLATKSTIASADITDGTVALADMANLAADQVIGRVTASTGVPETFTVTSAARGVLDDTTTAAMLTTLGAQPVDADLTTIAGLTATTNNVLQSVGSAWASRTPTQVTATLDLATAALKGLAPAFPNNTTTFLRGDGTYASPPVTGSGLLFQYQFNTTLTPPPISGGLRFNNATAAATTAIYVNYTTSDSIDVKTRLLLRIAGDKFYCQDKDNSSVYAQFRLTAAPTDNTTYATLTVVFESGAGTMPGGAILAGFTGAAIPNGDKGDITVTGDGATWTIDAAAVTLAKMADVATARFIGRTTAATGVPEALTGTQATALLDAVTSGAKGLAPASGGGTANFLRADGTWNAPAAGAPYTAPTTTVGGSVDIFEGTNNGTNKVSVRAPANMPSDIVLTLPNVNDTLATLNSVQFMSNKTLSSSTWIQTVVPQTGTAYTLSANEAGCLITLNNAAAITLTVPTNATAAMQVGTTIDLAQIGAGKVTVAGAGGVTVNATPSLGFRAQYSAATLIKLATDSWLLVGDLA